MWVSDNIAGILYVTGIVTCLPLLQFFAPQAMLKALNKLTIADEAGLFFARHWGIVVFSVGALLVYAAGHAEFRGPVMLAALIEKVGLIGAIASNWNRPFARGLRGAAIFDSACVLLYGAYLLKLG